MSLMYVGEQERLALAHLRERAAAAPLDMHLLQKQLQSDAGRQEHKERMTAQTVPIPARYFVTFSIETGHPVGTCRHMSMSVASPDRVPTKEALWLVAEELGFVGGLEQCQGWLDDLSDGGKAINIVQPVTVTAGGSA